MIAELKQVNAEPILYIKGASEVFFPGKVKAWAILKLKNGLRILIPNEQWINQAPIITCPLNRIHIELLSRFWLSRIELFWNPYFGDEFYEGAPKLRTHSQALTLSGQMQYQIRKTAWQIYKPNLKN